MSAVFLCTALVPNTEWLEGVVELTASGHVLVQDQVVTTVPGVFAIVDGSMAITKVWEYVNSKKAPAFKVIAC